MLAAVLFVEVGAVIVAPILVVITCLWRIGWSYSKRWANPRLYRKMEKCAAVAGRGVWPTAGWTGIP